MKIRIKYKLFLSMLAATGAVVICMFLIMQWSISRGFLAYVNTMERERFEKLAQLLEQSYATSGSWDFLKKDPGAWPRLARSAREGSFPERPEPGPMMRGKEFSNLSGHQMPLRYGNRFEGRVVVLDKEKRPVSGTPGRTDLLHLKKITNGGEVVGYLGLRPRQRLTDNYQLLFVKQQKLTLGLVALVMLLISAAISLPLANRLVLPIKRLASSMHRLASGRFDTREAVEGDDELGQLARDFNTLALTLENNERARKRYVADISHELRTPLAILRGEIEAIQDGVRQASADSMRSLHAEVMHLSRLVDDLYQISLYDIGALTYKKENIELREVLEDLLESFAPEFLQKGIALSVELPASGPFPVYADPDRLGQLFSNILDNSLKYTDRDGELSVRLQRRQQAAVIDFADSAPGVKPDELERLFDRLYRVESSRNRALGGAGLGLAICKNIVEAHEGEIAAFPSPNGGILIRIELPLTGGRV